MPDSIYHYTDIETLSLILKNQTIRFNRLDNVDDISEGDSFGKINLQKFLFVSCWTHDQKESIPQWNMYTRDMSGVRIKFPKYFFHEYEVEFKDELQFLGPKIEKSPIPLDRLVTDDYFVLTNFDNESDFASEVQYDEDYDQIKNELIEISSETDPFYLKIPEISKIAAIKSPDWKFQQEYRFILLIMPILNHDQMNWQERFHSSIRHCFQNGRGPDFDYFDIEIDEEVLSSIEVTTGPWCTEGQKILVDSLLEKYTTEGRMKESKLEGRIRQSS